MFENGKISQRQVIFLLSGTILGTSGIGFLPALIYREAAQDSWMSVFLMVMYGVAVGLIIVRLSRRFPEQTLVQYAGLVAGRIPGKIIGLIYIFYFLFFINTFVIRFFGELLVSIFMPETPLVVFLAGIVFAAAYAVRCGLEVIARTNEILHPVALFIALLLVVLLIPEMKFQNFTPVLENGILPVFRGTYIALVYFGEVIMLGMLLPYLNQRRQMEGIIFKGFLLIILFQLLSVLTSIAVFGAMLARIEVPAILGARLISIAELIERVEPLFLLLWIMAAFVKVSIFLYCGVLATAQWLHLKEYKPLALPTGLLLTVLSLIVWENESEMTEFMFLLAPHNIFIEAGLPLLLLALAWLRGKGAAKGNR